MPAETARAICSLIFGGVMEKYPNLKFAFAHGGGSFPATVGRVEHGWKVRPDLCAVDNPINPRDYLGRFWVDSLVHDEVSFDVLLKTVGADKICLGSDYPFPLGEQRPGELVESMDMSVETKQKIMFENAMDFLK
jgi:aminocarboxymuconate-semialdehyde decarboxylase